MDKESVLTIAYHKGGPTLVTSLDESNRFDVESRVLTMLSSTWDNVDPRYIAIMQVVICWFDTKTVTPHIEQFTRRNKDGISSYSHASASGWDAEDGNLTEEFISEDRFYDMWRCAYNGILERDTAQITMWNTTVKEDSNMGGG